MGKDELKEIDLEQELDALYKKVARLDSFEESERKAEGPSAPAKGEEESQRQLHSGESLSQATEKRSLRILGIVPALGLIALSFVVVAILVWPKIYRYESIHSGGWVYLVRVNSLTGDTMYFDGKEWQYPPVPAVSAKGLSGLPKDKPAPSTIRDWNYAVQIKAYPEASGSEAIAFVEYLKKNQPDVHMEKVHLPGKGTWYRVLLGYFVTAEEASVYMKEKRIATTYPDSFVRRKSEQ